MRVSKETAVLLKDAGSKLGSDFWCLTDSDDIIDTDKVGYRNRLLCPAPTLHEAADWLRSKGVHVGVECSDGIWSCSGQKCPDGGMLFDLPFCYDSHEAAYEAGIAHGLKYIK